GATTRGRKAGALMLFRPPDVTTYVVLGSSGNFPPLTCLPTCRELFCPLRHVNRGGRKSGIAMKFFQRCARNLHCFHDSARLVGKRFVAEICHSSIRIPCLSATARGNHMRPFAFQAKEIICFCLYVRANGVARIAANCPRATRLTAFLTKCRHSPAIVWW